MGGGGVMRAAAKVAGVGIVNNGLRGGPHVVTPSSAEHSVMRVAASRSAYSSTISVSSGGVDNRTTAFNDSKASWEMVDDWEFAGGFEEEAGRVGSAAGGEPMGRVLFGGVPSLEEAKEATTDLKDALDKVYLSSANSATDAAQMSPLSLLSNPEETKDCVSYNARAASVPKPAIQAFKLLNESPAVQSVVASIAADPNVWNAVLCNSAYMEFIQSQKTVADNEYEEQQGSSRSPESSSSVKLEEYFDENQPRDNGNPFSDFIQNIKTGVVDMVNKAADLFQSLFASPSAENSKENGGGGSNNFEKTMGAGLMGLVVMVIMVVLLKRV